MASHNLLPLIIVPMIIYTYWMPFGLIMTGSCGVSNILAWVALIVLKGMYHIE